MTLGNAWTIAMRAVATDFLLHLIWLETLPHPLARVVRKCICASLSLTRKLCCVLVSVYAIACFISVQSLLSHSSSQQVTLRHYLHSLPSILSPSQTLHERKESILFFQSQFLALALDYYLKPMHMSPRARVCTLGEKHPRHASPPSSTA